MSKRGKTRVGVIFGGRSGEHEVSLRSAESIIRSLDPSKYDVVPIAITHEGRWLGSTNSVAMLSAGEAIHSALTRGEPMAVSSFFQATDFPLEVMERIFSERAGRLRRRARGPG